MTADDDAGPPPPRRIAVRDEDDAAFFRATLRVLLQPDALSGEPPLLAASPPLELVSAGGERKPGGEWLARIPEPYDRAIAGRETSRHDGGRVLVHNRHEVESYLLDPVLLAAALQARGEPLDGFPAFADVSRLRAEPPEVLQGVIDGVMDRIETDELRNGYRDLGDHYPTANVTFVRGPTLRYPRWFMVNPARLVADAVRDAFGVRVSWDELRAVYERAGWIPVDLLAILRLVQTR